MTPPPASGRFDGRVVMIAGGTGATGRALAMAFIDQGAKVAITSRDPGHLKKSAGVIAARAAAPGAAGSLLPVRTDVRVAEAVLAAARAVAGAWGRIDVLINNARFSAVGAADVADPATEGEPAADRRWFEVIDTNLNGVYRMTRACLPHMPAGGRIVNLVLGPEGPAGPAATAFSAAEHGVVGLTRALAAELAARDIAINAIWPGWARATNTGGGLPEEPRRPGPGPDRLAAIALDLASPGAATGRIVGRDGAAVTW